MPDYYELAKKFLTNIFCEGVRVKDYEDLSIMLSQAYYAGYSAKEKEAYDQCQFCLSSMGYMTDEDYGL